MAQNLGVSSGLSRSLPDTPRSTALVPRGALSSGNNRGSINNQQLFQIIGQGINHLGAVMEENTVSIFVLTAVVSGLSRSCANISQRTIRDFAARQSSPTPRRRRIAPRRSRSPRATDTDDDDDLEGVRRDRDRDRDRDNGGRRRH